MICKKINITKLSIILVLFFTISDFTISLFYYDFAERYVKNSKCDQSDAIIVFFASQDKNGNLKELQITRLEKAIELYRNGWSANIICVGGNRSDHKLHGSENSAKYLILEGITPKNIFYDTLSFDTKSNLIEAYKIVDKNKFHSLIYVSDAVHLLRIESFSKRKSYCLASANYNATFIEKVMFCNQTFASYLFDFILPEYLYLKLIKLYRILN